MNKGLLLGIIAPLVAGLLPSDAPLLTENPGYGNRIVPTNPGGNILGNYESEDSEKKEKDLPEVEH